MFLNDLRLEGPVAIPRYLDRHRAKAALERLRRLAVARVAALVPGRVVLLVTDIIREVRDVLNRAELRRKLPGIVRQDFDLALPRARARLGEIF
jgi:hypothetical protein